MHDVELLTIELIGELDGLNGDYAIWRHADRYLRHLFPNLPHYKTFAKQSANLLSVKQYIFQHMYASGNFHIIDGVPIPLCHNQRANRQKSLREHAEWGYCAAKDEHYFGIKGHIVINDDHRIVHFALTPANIDEREILPDLIGEIEGLLIGDKGYISQEKSALLSQNGINLQTPLRKNMKENRPEKELNWLKRKRKRVETTLSTLQERLRITKIKAHNLWHFSSKLIRKLIAYNLSLDLNYNAAKS